MRPTVFLSLRFRKGGERCAEILPSVFTTGRRAVQERQRLRLALRELERGCPGQGRCETCPGQEDQGDHRRCRRHPFEGGGIIGGYHEGTPSGGYPDGTPSGGYSTSSGDPSGACSGAPSAIFESGHWVGNSRTPRATAELVV